ncbi:MAG: N-acetylglutaminylglutamine synthetase [Desulfofustis sp.]|nr:N-acetylglutaminylglutamine synthetase [Desulfofustis sp.]
MDQPCKNPLDPTCMCSLKHWGTPLNDATLADLPADVWVDCGWGRLIFGQTYGNPSRLAESIRDEQRGRRDVAMYIRDPHVVVSYAPQELFIDPSLTYRLDFRNYRTAPYNPNGLTVRPLQEGDSETAINRIYQARGMVPAYPGFYAKARRDERLQIFIALDDDSGEIVGAVTGVDHFRVFNDPDNGSSLWALAVDPQCRMPKVGEALVRELIVAGIENGRRFIDLSVMHSNKEAIALYAKLGFEQVPVYCIKNKNSINAPLFIGPNPEEQLNVYARIITDEARRRGIGVDVIDAENGYFRLSLGGRTITCRESLSELTSAVAMSWCDDKTITRSLLHGAGLRVPAQAIADRRSSIETFIKAHPRVVVKPARGEQGAGVCVDLTDLTDIETAVGRAAELGDKVVLEEFVDGVDLRIIVIDEEVVAAAVRKPARIRGTGELTIEQLIEKQSRRRAAATGGESTIPLDEETRRTVADQGYALSDVLPAGRELQVRKTANLHTGGTIHDVTPDLNPHLHQVAVAAARILQMPVVGFDFLVPDVRQDDYVIIEANERPGLANHEPQPTVEKFLDLLFPQTRNIFP